MSQSDYIRYKKIYRELKEYDSTPEKLPVVFESGKYIAYKEFSLENTILSNKTAYDKYIPQNTPVVFGMVKKCSAPTFELCRNTNLRGNRPTPEADGPFPSFRRPKVSEISKSAKMRWTTISDTNMCNCVA
jgi:hypothetical protein